METHSACALVHNLVYKPDWHFTAVPSERFEGTLVLQITYPAHRSERDQAPNYPEPIPGGARASFNIACGECNDDVGLYRKVIDVILHIECHEAREFLRVQPTMWAPFHPHRLEGMARWGDKDGDFSFGSA